MSLEQFGAGQMQHGITEEFQLFMVEFEEATGVGEGSRKFIQFVGLSSLKDN